MRSAVLALMVFGLVGCASDPRSPGALQRFQWLSALFRRTAQASATTSQDTVILNHALTNGNRSMILRSAQVTAGDSARLQRSSETVLGALADLRSAKANGIVRRYFGLASACLTEQRWEAIHLRNAMSVLRSDPYLIDPRALTRFNGEFGAALIAASRATATSSRATVLMRHHRSVFRYHPA